MNLQAQNPNWIKTFGNSNNDMGYSIAKTFDDGFIVGGTTTADNGNRDMLLLKLNNEGDTVWSKTFGGTFNDESFCVKQCRDSGYVIAGYKSTASSIDILESTTIIYFEMLTPTNGLVLCTVNDGTAYVGSVKCITVK